MASIAIMAAIAVGSAVVSYAIAPKPGKLPPVDRGRVDDIRLQTSEYNGMIPYVFGRARLAGNMFWSTEVQEHVSTTPGSSGGKGGGSGGGQATPETRNYSYTTNLALAFCMGNIKNGITKVWDGADLIINRDGAQSFYGFYEAEATTNLLSGGATRVNSSLASGGRVVRLATTGQSCEIKQIPQRGTNLTATIQYISNAAVNLSVYVNDVFQYTWTLSSSANALAIQTHTITLPASSGLAQNRVKIVNTSTAQFDLDYLQISDRYVDPIPTPTPWQTGLIDENLDYPSDFNRPLPYYNHYPATSGAGVTTGVAASGARGQFTFYQGTATQGQDPLMVSFDGAAFTPAYRNVCFMTIGDYELPGGQMRQWTVEVDEGTYDLADIMVALYGLAKHPSTQLDVTQLAGIYVPGLVISQRMQLSEVVSALEEFFAFDIIDLDGKIVAVKRGGASVVTIQEAEITPYKYGTQPPAGPAKVTRRDVLDLPQSVNIGFLDPALDYHGNSEPVSRQVGDSRDPATVNYPIVADAETAHQVGNRWLFSKFLEQEPIEFSLGPKYAYLAPSCVITLVTSEATYFVRIVSWQADLMGLIRVKAVPEKGSLYNQNQLGTTGDGRELPAVLPPANTELFIFNTPTMRLEDRGIGYWLTGCGRGQGYWRGAVVYEQDLGSTEYNELTVLTQAATMGLAVTQLGTNPGGAYDTTRTVRVSLYNGTLESHTQAELAANPNLNLCWLQGELLQFATATPVASPAFPYVATYDLSGFYRERFSTSGASHAVNDKFVLMDSTIKRRKAEPGEINQTRKFKAVSVGGMSLANAPELSYAIAVTRVAPPTGGTYTINADYSTMTVQWTKSVDPDVTYDVYKVVSGSDVFQVNVGDSTQYVTTPPPGVSVVYKIYARSIFSDLQSLTALQITIGNSWTPAATSLAVVEGFIQLNDGTYIPTIEGTIQFAGSSYKQRGRIWWQRPGETQLSATQTVVYPDPQMSRGTFRLDPAAKGAHIVKVITELDVDGTYNAAFAHPQQNITVVGLAPLPAPTGLAVKYVGFGDKNFTWQMGTRSVGKPEDVEQYLIRILYLGVEKRRHTIKIAEWEPIKWTYYTGTGAGNLTFDEWGGVTSNGATSALWYIGPIMTEDFDMEFEVDHRLAPATFGLVSEPVGAQTTGTYITRWSGNDAYVNPESASTFNRRCVPGDRYTMQMKARQVEYFFNGTRWWRSTQGAIPASVRPYFSFTGAEAQAALRCRMRRYNPRLFSYTYAMQQTDFAGSPPGSITFEVSQINSLGEQGATATLVG